MISKDLIHWQRLPSPLRPNLTDPAQWYDAKGSWDGSLTLLPKAQGGPVIVCKYLDQGVPWSFQPTLLNPNHNSGVA